MKHTTKITLLSLYSIITTIVIVIATALFTIKNTWRIAPDFSLCEDPEKIRPVVQKIGEDYVKLTVAGFGVGFNYEGCTWKLEKNKNDHGYTLYIGVKYVPLLGDGGQGTVIYVPKSKDEVVTKVVARGHGKERVIYDIESDQNKLQDYTNTSSEATSSLN